MARNALSSELIKPDLHVQEATCWGFDEMPEHSSPFTLRWWQQAQKSTLTADRKYFAEHNSNFTHESWLIKQFYGSYTLLVFPEKVRKSTTKLSACSQPTSIEWAERVPIKFLNSRTVTALIAYCLAAPHVAHSLDYWYRFGSASIFMSETFTRQFLIKCQASVQK